MSRRSADFLSSVRLLRGISVWFITKAVHLACPLDADQCTLYMRQNDQSRNDGGRKPDNHLYPCFRTVEFLYGQQSRDNKVKYDHHCKVRRCIICALVMEFQSTVRAGVVDLDVSIKDLSFSAFRAFAGQASKKGRFNRSFFSHVRLISQ